MSIQSRASSPLSVLRGANIAGASVFRAAVFPTDVTQLNAIGDSRMLAFSAFVPGSYGMSCWAWRGIANLGSVFTSGAWHDTAPNVQTSGAPPSNSLTAPTVPDWFEYGLVTRTDGNPVSATATGSRVNEAGIDPTNHPLPWAALAADTEVLVRGYLYRLSDAVSIGSDTSIGLWARPDGDTAYNGNTSFVDYSTLTEGEYREVSVTLSSVPSMAAGACWVGESGDSTTNLKTFAGSELSVEASNTLGVVFRTGAIGGTSLSGHYLVTANFPNGFFTYMANLPGIHMYWYDIGTESATSKADAKSQLDDWIARMRTLDPGCLIVLSTPFDQADASGLVGFQSTYHELAAHQVAVETEDVALLPLGATFPRYPDANDDGWFSDNVHLTTLGNQNLGVLARNQWLLGTTNGNQSCCFETDLADNPLFVGVVSTLTGMAALAGLLIRITVNGVLFGTTISGSDGSWQISSLVTEAMRGESVDVVLSSGSFTARTEKTRVTDPPPITSGLIALSDYNNGITGNPVQLWQGYGKYWHQSTVGSRPSGSPPSFDGTDDNLEAPYLNPTLFTAEGSMYFAGNRTDTNAGAVLFTSTDAVYSTSVVGIFFGAAGLGYDRLLFTIFKGSAPNSTETFTIAGGWGTGPFVVAATWSVTGGVQLYKDGVAQTLAGGGTLASPPSGAHTRIPKMVYKTSGLYAGTIKAFAAYNQHHTPGEVASMSTYLAGL